MAMWLLLISIFTVAAKNPRNTLANCLLTVDGEVARGLHVQLLDHNLVGALLRRGWVLDDERVGVLLEAPVVLVALEQLQPELAASDVLIE